MRAPAADGADRGPDDGRASHGGRKQFLLRIDPDLWSELERWAADELRSVNAQVEWLLREAVRKRRRLGAARRPRRPRRRRATATAH